jgi:hypothetical protein
MKRFFNYNSRQFYVGGVSLGFSAGILFSLSACSSGMPSTNHKNFAFPDTHAFYGNVKRPYQTLGIVRAKVNFVSLDPNREENDLCRNYFNKSVRDLVKFAKDKGGDAVIDVKSVVFLENGKSELYPSAECADDGMEGQVLSQGIAIRWKEPKEPKEPNS